MFKRRKIEIFSLIFCFILCAELLFKQYRLEVGVSHASLTYNDLRIGAEYIALNILYLIWLRKAKLNDQQDSRIGYKVNFVQAIAPYSIFLLLAFISYPNTKTDIYTYLHSGLMILNGINPYIVPAGDFYSKVSPYFSWLQTSTYGPISQSLFVISALFTTINIILGIYIFKVLCLIFHVLNAFLIWNQLKDDYLKNILVIAYLVNPILLFEQVSQAHIDVFLCTSLILLIRSIRGQSWFLSVMLIWVGVLTKTIPIIWLPLMLFYLIIKKKYKTLILSLLASLAVIFIVTFVCLGSLDGWSSLTNPGVSFRTNRSLHIFLITIFKNFTNILPSFLSGEYAYRVYLLSKWITYMAYILYYAVTLYGMYWGIRKKSYSEIHLILTIGWTSLLLFLFATPWNPSWYVTILIPIAFLVFPIKDSDVQRFVNTSLIFCVSSSTYYLLTLKGSSDFLLGVDGLIAFLPTTLYLIKPKTFKELK
jgi:alpha-1,6-mannosyltransferase